MGDGYRMLGHIRCIVVFGLPILAGILFVNGNILFDNGKIAMTATDNPCCCQECTPCKANTFSTTTIATVDFGGTIINSSCANCIAAMLTPTFDLSKQTLPALGDPCKYTLTGLLGCNSGTDGFDSLTFQWYVDDGINARAVLTLHYKCGTGEGNWEWTVNFTYSPTLYDCLATIAMGTPTNNDSCSGLYFPCDMFGVTASVSFS